jgi:hypothetical protein
MRAVAPASSSTVAVVFRHAWKVIHSSKPCRSRASTSHRVTVRGSRNVVLDRLPGGAGRLSADRLQALPADVQAAVAAAYGAAVPPVFGYVAPLLGVAFVLALALPARPLRDTAYADEPAAEPGTHQKG